MGRDHSTRCHVCGTWWGGLSDHDTTGCPNGCNPDRWVEAYLEIGVPIPVSPDVSYDEQMEAALDWLQSLLSAPELRDAFCKLEVTVVEDGPVPESEGN